MSPTTPPTGSPLTCPWWCLRSIRNISQVIPASAQRLGTQRGFIAVKSNCSLQSYVPALHPLREKFGVEKALVCTYQAISGAGKTFETWPEMVDNVIPYIGGEEEKSEQEPLKMWGHSRERRHRQRRRSRQDHRPVPPCPRLQRPHGRGVHDLRASRPPWKKSRRSGQNYKGRAQELELPSAPKQFLHYFEEPQLSPDQAPP